MNAIPQHARRISSPGISNNNRRLSLILSSGPCRDEPVYGLDTGVVEGEGDDEVDLKVSLEHHEGESWAWS